MTAPIRSFPISTQVSASHPEHGDRFVKSLADNFEASNRPHGKEALSDVIVKALWKSYPGCESEDDLAKEARLDFRTDDGRPISPRTIKYWLRGETLPSVLHFSTLVMMQPKLFLCFWFGRFWG